ncbi:MAG: trimethylamine methyltransferase family protein, partial [Pseudomonadota bacterium]
MNDQTPLKPSRAGGRAARRAARAAPLTEDLRPVRSGMSGGVLKPLSQAEIERIHEAALQCLEEIGLADAPGSGVETLTAAGALLGDDGR